MFEKEAEELIGESLKSTTTLREIVCKAIEFGYNKAKEDADKLKDMRIKELENALKKIAETVPDSYKNYKYLPESRLDIIGDICEEVGE